MFKVTDAHYTCETAIHAYDGCKCVCCARCDRFLYIPKEKHLPKVFVCECCMKEMDVEKAERETKIDAMVETMVQDYVTRYEALTGEPQTALRASAEDSFPNERALFYAIAKCVVGDV